MSRRTKGIGMTVTEKPKIRMRDWFIFSAPIAVDADQRGEKKAFIVLLVVVTAFSGLRQLVRQRASYEGDVDAVNLLITMVLTFTFYPLLLKAYEYAHKRKGTKSNSLLRDIVLVAQFAVMRDFLYILYALVRYNIALFASWSEPTNIGSSDEVFVILDALLWWLTIIYMVPRIMQRLRSDQISGDKLLLFAFILSATVFWAAWVLNYAIIRIFVQLPLGRGF